MQDISQAYGRMLGSDDKDRFVIDTRTAPTRGAASLPATVRGVSTGPQAPAGCGAFLFAG
ncbi:hypothetical protein [Stenotrophomonas sp. YIM B06876]|uniref:hypothetical protein n=1 Tax=Stenotrophomonas sp. YIM B06876 TaxID=3060211 RepID=UPI00273A572D|nr:hypothetical protein [Stenotrophomonas sp. YIM B06876]